MLSDVFKQLACQAFQNFVTLITICSFLNLSRKFKLVTSISWAKFALKFAEKTAAKTTIWDNKQLEQANQAVQANQTTKTEKLDLFEKMDEASNCNQLSQSADKQRKQLRSSDNHVTPTQSDWTNLNILTREIGQIPANYRSNRSKTEIAAANLKIPLDEEIFSLNTLLKMNKEILTISQYTGLYFVISSVPSKY